MEQARFSAQRRILGLAIASLVVTGALAATAGAGPATTAQYVSGGTLVSKPQGEVDNGVVVCNTKGGPSVGGACIPFGTHSAVLVQDLVAGTKVAFQVCIDNNGDGKCGGGREGGGERGCSDDQFFSHNDKGAFFNPLGPLPQGFRWGCAPKAAFPGYVVFLCEGVHTAGGAHAHAVTTGSVAGVPKGTGFGDFCFPSLPTQVKTYTVV